MPWKGCTIAGAIQQAAQAGLQAIAGAARKINS
jgi:hypothetical protein